MITVDIINWFLDLFRQVYALGNQVELFTIGNTTVSLNSFLIALTVMSIVLTSLLTFARSHAGTVADRAEDAGRSLYSRLKNRKNS